MGPPLAGDGARPRTGGPLAPAATLALFGGVVLLAAAAALILTAIGVLAGLDRATRPDGSEPPGPGLEGALYPPAVASWLEGESEPTVEELAFSATAPASGRSAGGDEER